MVGFETGKVPFIAWAGYYPTTKKFYVIQVDENGKVVITSTDLTTLLSEVQSATYGLSALKTSLNRHLTYVDCWSDESATVTITGSSTDVDLPDIIVPTLPTGASIWKVVLLFKCALIRDTSASDNAINGASAIRIKKSTGAWGTDDIVAYDIVDNLWLVDVSVSTDRGGDAFVGNINNDDLSGEVDASATYNLRFEDIQADGNNLVLYEVCVGLRVYFY